MHGHTHTHICVLYVLSQYQTCIHIIRPVNMSTFGQSTDIKIISKIIIKAKSKAGITGNHRFFFLFFRFSNGMLITPSGSCIIDLIMYSVFMGEVPYRLEHSGPTNHKRFLRDFNVLY